MSTERNIAVVSNNNKTTYMAFTFGKFKYVPFTKVPLEYLEWISINFGNSYKLSDLALARVAITVKMARIMKELGYTESETKEIILIERDGRSFDELLIRDQYQ